MDIVPEWKDFIVVGIVALETHHFNFSCYIQGISHIGLSVWDLSVEDKKVQVHQKEYGCYELYKK